MLHRETNIKCDVSVTNGMAVQNSKLFAHLFHIQREAINLVQFIKRWLQIFNVKRIRGFTLTLLVVFFLQYEKMMPPIEKVQENMPKTFIDGENFYLRRQYIKAFTLRILTTVCHSTATWARKLRTPSAPGRHKFPSLK